jgi:hypothetical protein
MRATNHSHARNGAVRKRPPAKPHPAESSVVETTGGLPELAGFAPANRQPVDAEMWPIQPVMWFQPEWKPGLPASSGLRVERHHRIPVPGFLSLETGYGYDLDETVRHGQMSNTDAAPGLPPVLPPAIPLTPPRSGLTLLGWDPRAVVPVVKEGQG